jgi:hypothetical protein
MEAVGGELLGSNIVPELARPCSLGHQVADHVAKLSLRLPDPLIPM